MRDYLIAAAIFTGLTGLIFLTAVSANTIRVTAVVRSPVHEPASTPEAPQLSVTSAEAFQTLTVEHQSDLLGLEL